MKKLLIILFIVGIGIKVKAQSFHSYADTANYLIHQIENKKNIYVGHPLSTLMDSLKLQPVSVIPSGLTQPQNGYGKVISLYFNYRENFSKTHILSLEFLSVPSYTTLSHIFYPSPGVYGSFNSIMSVYRTLIISDLWVKDYTEDEPVNPNVHY